jgi:hypothetical protein
MERDQLENLGVDGIVIVKWIFKFRIGNLNFRHTLKPLVYLNALMMAG